MWCLKEVITAVPSHTIFSSKCSMDWHYYATIVTNYQSWEKSRYQCRTTKRPYPDGLLMEAIDNCTYLYSLGKPNYYYTSELLSYYHIKCQANMTVQLTAKSFQNLQQSNEMCWLHSGQKWSREQQVLLWRTRRIYWYEVWKWSQSLVLSTLISVLCLALSSSLSFYFLENIIIINYLYILDLKPPCSTGILQ